jgi:hypothetical protein
LHVPVSAPEEAYITEEEEEEDKLAQGSDVGDKGMQRVWVGIVSEFRFIT